MKKKILKFLIWLFVIELNLYLLWSKFYRLLQKKRTKIPAMAISTMEKMLCAAEWEKDKWYMLGDAISHPEASYYKYLKTGKLGDCDDFSTVAADILWKIVQKKNVKMLSVQWYDKEGKFHGHNVCIFKNYWENKINWVSNWFCGKIQYTDYVFLDDIDKIINDIIKDGELISFMIIDPFKMKLEGWKVNW